MSEIPEETLAAWLALAESTASPDWAMRALVNLIAEVRRLRAALELEHEGRLAAN
jgi:hypothetical protein